MSEPNSDCPEEKRTHGDSPFGSVKDEEMLVRYILLGDKKSVDGDDFCIPSSFLRTRDFLKRDGWSFVRRDFIGDILTALAKHAEKTGKRGEDYGYALVKAEHIREILDDMQRQAICVIDDPQPDNPAHALAQKSREYCEEDAREIRDKVLQKIGEVQTINSV